MTCTITGLLTAPTGAILPNTAVVFRRERTAVVGQDGDVVIPNEVPAQSDAEGQITVVLYPGRYVARATTTTSAVQFVVGVPDAATADLADLIDQSPAVTPSVLSQAVAARDAAVGAAGQTAQDRQAVEAAVAPIVPALDDIEAVAGIAADVTAVAGVSADVATVAAIAPDVSAVAAVADDVTAVTAFADQLADVGPLMDGLLVAVNATQADAEATAADREATGADVLATAASAAAAAGSVTQAGAEADRAEVARDAAFVNADVFADIATGRAAVADGVQFQVVSGDEVIRYRRDSSSTQTEVARYPSAAIVKRTEKVESKTSQFGVALKGDPGLLDAASATLDADGVVLRQVLSDGTSNAPKSYEDEAKSVFAPTIDPTVAAGVVGGNGVLLYGALQRSGLFSGLRQEPPSGLAYLSGVEGARVARATMRDGNDVVLSPGLTDVSRLVQSADTVSFWDEGSGSVVDQGLWDAAGDLAGGVNTLYFVPVYGQSNGGQFGSQNLAITDQPDSTGRSLSFSYGTLLARTLASPLFDLSELSHLINATENHGPGKSRGETPCSGLGWALAAALPSTAAVVTASLAVGGNAITGAPGLGLNKGTFGYSSILMAVRRMKVICDIAGIDLVVPAVPWFQGESNNSTVYAAYDADYVQLQADLDADIKAITGQTQAVLLASHQISAWTNGGTSRVGQPIFVQLDRAVSDPSKFLCSGVNYIYAHPDGIHSSAIGKRRAGEIIGRAIGRRLVDAVTNPMLYIQSAVRSGSTITLTYDGAEGALAFDAAVNDPGARGFRFTQTGGTLPTITDVAISGATVVITLSAIPDGTAQTISYADNTTSSGSGAGGGTTGPRGQLRDSAVALHKDGSPAYKWAQHQRIIVS